MRVVAFELCFPLLIGVGLGVWVMLGLGAPWHVAAYTCVLTAALCLDWRAVLGFRE